MAIKPNKIYWKTSNNTVATSLLRSLSDKYLIVQVAERKENEIKILKQYNSGMQHNTNVGVEHQINFVRQNHLVNDNQFYIISSIDF